MSGVKGRSGKARPGQKKRGPINKTKAGVAELRTKIFALAKEGYPQTRIADKIGCDQSLVSYHFRIVLKQLARERDADALEVLSLKIAQLHTAQFEALEAWHRSKNDYQMRRTVDKDFGDKSGTEITEERRGQTGDPRHMDSFLKALDMELKLRAMYPDKELHIKGRIDAAGIDFDRLAGVAMGDGADIVNERIQTVLRAIDGVKVVQTEEVPPVMRMLPVNGEQQ